MALPYVLVSTIVCWCPLSCSTGELLHRSGVGGVCSDGGVSLELCTGSCSGPCAVIGLSEALGQVSPGTGAMGARLGTGGPREEQSLLRAPAAGHPAPVTCSSKGGEGICAAWGLLGRISVNGGAVAGIGQLWSKRSSTERVLADRQTDIMQ